MTEHTQGPWRLAYDDGKMTIKHRTTGQVLATERNISHEMAAFITEVANGAHAHSHASDFLSAATSHENPQLWRIEYLDALLRSFAEGTVEQDEREDPDAFAEMLQILRELVTDTRAAIARGQS